MKFRLPRKIKKAFNDKILLYPPNEDGDRVMAHPKTNQEDYNAFKSGILSPMFSTTKVDIKKRQIEFNLLYCQPIQTSDESLSDMVNEVFAEEYRKNALSMLLRAKTNPNMIDNYYIFINAYNLGKHSISAMCYDGLERKS